MKARSRAPVIQPDVERRSPIVAAISLLVFATLVIVPLYIQLSGEDMYRRPKLIIFHAVALLLAPLLVLLAFRAPVEFKQLWREQRTPVILAAAALLWTGVATAMSSNHVLSASSLKTVFASMVLFVAALIAFRKRASLFLLVPLAPALVNAVVATLQRTGIWNPFSFEDVYDLHIRTVGLMGNPNYVGSYLLTAAIAAIAATIAMKRYRLMMVTFAVIVVAGLLASQSIAAIVSLVIGIMAMTLPARRKSMRFATLAAGVILALVAVTYGPVRDRIANMSELARRGQYLELSSRRTPAYLAAWSMFTDNPLTGVGPGTFHWWYMPVRIELDKVYGMDLHKVSENFGEVHNDHLQLLAETGLPGYLIFLVALTYISLISFLHRRSSSPDTEKSRFIRFFGFPSAVAVFAVCLAQFPLQLPASIVTNIGFAALFLAMHADETRR